jgi:hydroxymethylpyrimidine pyrophosphatase-like HAD family hydrolase
MGVFRVGLVDKASGDRRDEYVAAEGAGVGYLGRHALSVATRLRDFLPTVYGLRDGLLYRAWLPEQWRQTPRDDERLAARMASYVVARKHALAVSEDTTRRLIGRDTATDLVARMISEAFGKGSLPARPLVQGVARRLLETAHPSVIDGSMTLQHWFAPSGDWGAAQKVDFHTRAFSNEDRYCYDAVYDLACAAASGRSGALANALVSAYEDLAGEPVEPERWLLYQLLHHHQTERPKAVAEGDIARFVACERAMALAHQLYFAGVFFSDLPVPTSGPLCAIDVDWVLEVRWLGFPAISPASALALRMLARHGYRPTIATGRSLAEMQRRCESYRLAGGVAEYGAVVYDHASRRTRSLLSGSDHAALAELAERLSSIPGVYVEPGRKHSVRAFRLQRGGTVGLDEATIRTALSGVSSRDRLRPIRARSQTDFVIADVDKGIGVRALAEELGGARLALSVGDSIDDLPMLRLAERAAAPSNADAALSRVVSSGDAVIQRASHPYGSGLLEVVSDVVGHPRRTCPTCAAPQGSGSASALMLTALAALDGGARKKARQAAILSSRLALLRLAAVAPITPSPQLRGRAGRNGRARFASE